MNKLTFPSFPLTYIPFPFFSFPSLPTPSSLPLPRPSLLIFSTFQPPLLIPLPCYLPLLTSPHLPPNHTRGGDQGYLLTFLRGDLKDTLPPLCVCSLLLLLLLLLHNHILTTVPVQSTTAPHHSLKYPSTPPHNPPLPPAATASSLHHHSSNHKIFPSVL